MTAEVYVDRIEGDFAVLLAQDGALEFDVPLALLPPEVEPGWILDWTLTRRPDAERDAQARVASLQAALIADDDGGDLVL